MFFVVSFGNFRHTICGIAENIREFFRPYLSDIQPKYKFPIKDPIGIYEPTHDTWSTVIGPVANGESEDKRIGKFAEGHPQTVPKAIVLIFAK